MPSRQSDIGAAGCWENLVIYINYFSLIMIIAMAKATLRRKISLGLLSRGKRVHYQRGSMSGGNQSRIRSAQVLKYTRKTKERKQGYERSKSKLSDALPPSKPTPPPPL